MKFQVAKVEIFSQNLLRTGSEPGQNRLGTGSANAPTGYSRRLAFGRETRVLPVLRGRGDPSLVASLLPWLVVGLVFELVVGLVFELVVGLVAGLVAGLVVGLVVGLVGLTWLLNWLGWLGWLGCWLGCFFR